MILVTQYISSGILKFSQYTKNVSMLIINFHHLLYSYPKDPLQAAWWMVSPPHSCPFIKAFRKAKREGVTGTILHLFVFIFLTLFSFAPR